MAEQIIYDQGSTYKVKGNLDLTAPTIQVLKAPVSGFPVWVPAGFPPVRWTDIQIIEAVQPNVFYDDFKAARPEVAAEIEGIEKVDTKPVNLLDVTPAVDSVKATAKGISNSFTSVTQGASTTVKYAAVGLTALALISILQMVRK